MRCETWKTPDRRRWVPRAFGLCFWRSGRGSGCGVLGIFKMKTSHMILTVLVVVLIITAAIAWRGAKKRDEARTEAVWKALSGLEARVEEIESRQEAMAERQEQEHLNTTSRLQSLSGQIERYYKLHATALDCSQKFSGGVFGVPSACADVAAILAANKSFKPVYIEKTGRRGFKGDCSHVSANDYFRLVFTPSGTLGYAGCYGDFDGDCRRDYALLLADPTGHKTGPSVFLRRGDGFVKTCLWSECEKQGFSEQDAELSGPLRVDRPADGIFRSPYDERAHHVPGDLIAFGWFTYYWDSHGQFVSVQTVD